jgi:hypothetical protein
MPDLRHCRLASAKLADLELSLFDLLCQLDAADHHPRRSKAFQPQHRTKAVLHTPMVLLDQVVQILADSRSNTRLGSSPVSLKSPTRPVRGGIAVERDFCGHPLTLHRLTQEGFCRHLHCASG